MTTIAKVAAREMLDSRGLPTVEVALETGKGTKVIASVPSGASTGKNEAHELRDGEKRFGGKGVRRAVENINGEIARAFVGKEFDQRQLDAALVALDGTPDKSRLGANAILAVSLAFARASAVEAGVPLYSYINTRANQSVAADARFASLGHIAASMPTPSFNVLNGGKHADSGLSVQEFMLVPQRGTTAERIEVAAACIATLRENLHAKGLSIGVGDEGGFAPKIGSNEDALDALVAAITGAGYTTDDVKIAIDSAASSFYTEGKYTLGTFGNHLDTQVSDTGEGNQKTISTSELASWYEGLLEKYPIISFEDPFAEEDWDAFVDFTKRIGGRALVVGDDLLTTNVARMQIAVEKKAVTSALIKPNQIGTVSETIDAVLFAKSQGWVAFASHRSGETGDTAIADIAVGLGCTYLKAGSLARGERVCKYNRLMEIADELAA